MIHVGDITKLSGWTLPIVDVITGGSPCQDLSVAGKRAGLEGERSGLFMEQVRIVKEMRERDRKENGRTNEFIRARYMVWENVPGAFSSNGGRDFQAVLTEIIRIAEPEAPDVPMSEKGGWSKSGCLYDEMGNWSVAWRLHDAQFWGVAQRRKRICVLADFGGLTAPWILFDPQLERTTERDEPVSLSGYSGAECRPEVQTESESLSGNPVESRGDSKEETAAFAGSGFENTGIRVYGICADSSNSMKSSNPHSGIYEAAIARTLDLNGGTPACNQGGMAVVCLKDQNGNSIDIAQPVLAVYENHILSTFSLQRIGKYKESDKGHNLSARDYKDATDLVVYASTTENGISPTLDASYYKGTGARGGAEREVVAVYSPDVPNALTAKEHLQFQKDGKIYNVILIHPEVRRLTPLECTRLQGFPDGWLDIGDWTDDKGKVHKDADSPKYKAAGNSIALPFWSWLARRICAQYERPITMGSLFDGIGGFPLVFERCGAKAVWASEIEPYPIAVTKKHFPEVGNEQNR